MSFFKFKTLSQYIRSIPPGNVKYISAKNFSISKKLKNSWSVQQKLSIILPIGIGISTFTFLRWMDVKNLGHDVYGSTMSDSAYGLAMQCYYYLPWRVTSRIIGWIASIELPPKFRPFVYNKYAEFYNVNLDEIDCDLELFPTLVDFFVRPLKPKARPIAMNTNIVSPADGTILHLGPVLTSRVQRVKGVTYNVRYFLGDIKSRLHEDDEEFTNEDNDKYIKSLLKNTKNSLYQLTIYLAPGDYHRFHSASTWNIKLRRHFQGKLLSVNPKIASWFPHLLEINERVVYIGDWTEGFMAYVAVGATNVGSIRVYCDSDLRTNTMWNKADNGQDHNFNSTKIAKGQLFGEFRLGSTVVILFEAPKDICFSAKVGQAIKMGEALTMLPTKCYRNDQISTNLNELMFDALNVIGFG